jgi:TolB-like protein
LRGVTEYWIDHREGLMKHLCILVLLSIIICCSTPLFADQTMPLAVMDVKSRNVPKIVANAVSDIIRSEFTNYGNFEVAERAQIDKVLDEQGLQLTGVTEPKGAVKIGRLLSVKKIVIGEANALGKGMLLTLRVVDVETGVAEYAERERTSMDDAEKAAVTIARRLAQRIVQKYKTYFTAKIRSEYYIRGIVPGWSQIYADHPVKGVLFAAAFVASVGFTVYAYRDYRKKDDTYHDVEFGAPQSEFDSKYDDYDKAGKIYNYALLGTLLIYTLHWVDTLFFSVPDFDGEEKKVGSTFIDVQFFNQFNARNEQYVQTSVGIRF